MVDQKTHKTLIINDNHSNHCDRERLNKHSTHDDLRTFKPKVYNLNDSSAFAQDVLLAIPKQMTIDESNLTWQIIKILSG